MEQWGFLLPLVIWLDSANMKMIWNQLLHDEEAESLPVTPDNLLYSETTQQQMVSHSCVKKKNKNVLISKPETVH